MIEEEVIPLDDIETDQGNQELNPTRTKIPHDHKLVTLKTDHHLRTTGSTHDHSLHTTTSLVLPWRKKGYRH